MRNLNRNIASLCCSMERQRLPGELGKCDRLKDPRKRSKCRRTVAKKSAERSRMCRFI